MRRPFRRVLLVGTAIVLANSAARAQTVSPARDSVYRRFLNFGALVKNGTVAPRWLPDGRSFWYLDGLPDQPEAWRVDPAANAVRPLIDPVRVRAALDQAQGGTLGGRGLPFTSLDLVDGERAARFTVAGQRWELDLGTYAIRRVAEPPPPAGAAPNETASPDGRWFAYPKANNLWLRSPIDGRSVQLTDDGTDGETWTAQAGPTGALYYLSWSPNSAYLMAFKTDVRKVRRIPVVSWLKPGEEQVDWAIYPMSGTPLPTDELYVIDVLSRRMTKIDTGTETDRQLRIAGWQLDRGQAFVVRTNRLVNQVELLSADIATGKSTVLVTEKQPTFVEGLALQPGNLLTPFKDGSRFVWRSERDGWSHLYLYQANGTLIRQLTRGPAPVERVVAVDEERGWVYFLAHGDARRPYDVHLYRVDLAGNGFTKLTEATGEHAVTFSPSKEYFIDTHSTVDRPPASELRRADGQAVRVLSTADIGQLKSLGWRAPEEFTVKAADGTSDLFGALYKPYDFDPAKKYPVVDLQYMGNFIASAPHRFMGTWLGDDAQALTQLGFIVYIVDARGTTGRGKAFQDFTFHNLGKIEVPDHVAALRQLAATRSYMDTTRVGITGYSWGGYFTIRALLTAPEVFKVGVSGAPVVDMMAANAPVEPYMGTPQSNPTGYAEASNITLADKLRGRLLVVIGTSDVNVTFNHSMRLANAFIKAGKFIDMIIMPGEAHGLTPDALRYYNEARARYLVEHLKPE